MSSTLIKAIAIDEIGGVKGLHYKTFLTPKPIDKYLPRKNNGY
ncbi:MAG: hypothetical protein V7L31_02750 [Nostoc sp.]